MCLYILFQTPAIAAGTSRSPSVVLAAIMKAKGLALEQALGVLRAKAPHICPNPGFMAQLELWGEMGCCLDEEHPAYKQFLLDQVSQLSAGVQNSTQGFFPGFQ